MEMGQRRLQPSGSQLANRDAPAHNAFASATVVSLTDYPCWLGCITLPMAYKGTTPSIRVDISIFFTNFLLFSQIYLYLQKKNRMYSKIYEQSGSDLIRDLGKRFCQYRKRMGCTQKGVSAKSGISVFTISSFENGTATGLTLSSFIKIIRAIDCLEEIEKLLPPLPESPRALFNKQQKKQRLWKQTL